MNQDQEREETKANILSQVLVAFGQGTGPIRVSRKAARALTNRYRPMITREVIEQWDEEGGQALERIRAIGRLAAQTMTQKARSAINADDVIDSARAVERASGTGFCDG